MKPHPEVAHLPSLEEFFEKGGSWANAYIAYGPLESYHRLGRRAIGTSVYKTVTRANTTNVLQRHNFTSDLGHKPSGAYRKLDKHTEDLARKYGFEAILVECVLNHFLPAVLERYGYTMIPNGRDTGRDFYKLL